MILVEQAARAKEHSNQAVLVFHAGVGKDLVIDRLNGCLEKAVIRLLALTFEREEEVKEHDSCVADYFGITRTEALSAELDEASSLFRVLHRCSAFRGRENIG